MQKRRSVCREARADVEKQNYIYRSGSRCGEAEVDVEKQKQMYRGRGDVKNQEQEKKMKKTGADVDMQEQMKRKKTDTSQFTIRPTCQYPTVECKPFATDPG